MVLRFLVVADSHIRFPDDDAATYPSNALMADRNRFAVELCNRLQVSFVVHLGDIVHPIPTDLGHRPAVDLAAGIYAELRHPIHFVPGNHDLGDKPSSLVAVPPVAPRNYEVFERAWGSAFGSFDVGDLHGVILDTPVLGSGLEREAAQRAWVEADLAAARGKRIFVFTHYPPFVMRPDEPEHYDNLGEPARSWLLDLLEQCRAEAVFSGHVHHFFFNHHRGTEFYIAPSTGFVRPDYSELASIGPEDEFGRNDPAKLGLLLVEVGENGHVVRPIRTWGAVDDAEMPLRAGILADPGWTNPLGVTLRHGLGSTVDLPTAGLDEFRRKTVRNDGVIPALWEARITDVRLPLADAIENGDRLRHLSSRGLRFTLRSAGVPEPGDPGGVVAAGAHRWEVVAPSHSFEAIPSAVEGSTIAVAFGPVVPLGPPGHHFVTAGFDPVDANLLERWIEADPHGAVPELLFRIAWTEPIEESVAAAAACAEAVGRRAVVGVELPRAGESRLFEDDDAVAARVAEAVIAADRHPGVAVFLDGFMDHDRGYYPHHGLVDRRFNPRPALYRLIEEAARC